VTSRFDRVPLPRVILAIALLIAIVLSCRGILSDDPQAMFDMPRYLMNGVFLRDLIAAGPPHSVESFITFAADYYARYPALSLGHHPPLLPAMLVPAYATLGVSIFSARLLIVILFVAGVLAVYGLGRELFDEMVGAWAALLLACDPAVIIYAQQVMSEVPMLSLMLIAGWQLAVFTRTGKARHYAGFAAAAALSLYARQFAVFALPAYIAIIWLRGAWRLLLRRDIVILTIVAILFMLPLVPLTLMLSRFNVSVVTGGVGRDSGALWRALTKATLPNLKVALWLPVVVGLGYGLWRQRSLVWIPLIWAASTIIFVAVVTGRVEPWRYAIGCAPGFCLLGATIMAWRVDRPVRLAMTIMLALVVMIQTVASAFVQPVGVSGYAAAVRWVLAQHSPAPTVLFDGPFDSGYFSFFLRKYDTEHRLVMLRADKLFATSIMGWHGVLPKITGPDQIDPMLQAYGTRYVVVEELQDRSVLGDFAGTSAPLEWLHEELKTSRFAERLRVPTVSEDPMFHGTSLVVYEFLEATPPAPDAVLNLDLPLVSRKITVSLRHLTDGTGSAGNVLDAPPEK
jgi:Dolichyl-phosphate-mannose-protein mannosyltransferase